ncbi:MAG TPA: phytanoyl-CoA dioxygenase family protein [Capsulimonadaceae bacterium]|nr:phytanoyl-CoA dioxygenase family protein [Capsulimonadaceae bacterium]
MTIDLGVAETPNAAQGQSNGHSDRYQKGRVTPEQVAFYDREGYLLYDKPVFNQSRFERLKAIFEDDLARYGDEDLDTIHFRDDRLFEFLFSDEVMGLVEPIIGPNIGLWSSHFISKPPRVGKATPWHEDSSYWKGRISTMVNIVTVWLAIDEANPENGCMKVIPGTHTNGYSEYEMVDATKNIFGSQIKADQFDAAKTVYFSLKPNFCSLHEAQIIHGADANTSDKRRCGYTMRYFPTTSQVYPEKWAGHKIWLAKGKDIAGNRFENTVAGQP